MKDKEDIVASKERRVVQDALNKLISDEWFAGHIYKQFIILVDDHDRAKVQQLFNDIALDELNDHYESLVKFAKQNQYDVPSTYSEMKKYADKADVKLFENCKKGKDALFYLDEAAKSEERAIQAYEKCMDIDETDGSQELLVVMQSNYYDEQQHLKDIQFAVYSIESVERIG